MERNRIDVGRAKLARMARRLNARAQQCPVRGLVLMTDDTLGADWLEGVLALPAGAGVIVRARSDSVREALARALKAACRQRSVKLLVSDDIGLAQRMAADGVHFPERRMEAARFARRVNRRWILSASVHSLKGVALAKQLPVDFLFASPFLETRSHPGARALGQEGLGVIVAAARQPVFALGGIDDATVQRLASVRVAGFGLIRGWLGRDGA